jgi:thymidylate synthase ThyX
MIKAEIVGDSRDPRGHRLTSFLVTFPRIILAELNTHRMFSRNSASSRAIPFKKMVEVIKTNPFIPIAWQKEHKGMQGSEYFQVEENIHKLTEGWLQARDTAIQIAQGLDNSGVTKQICNRLLEPFMWHTVLITAEEEGLENFFALRCPQYCIGDEGDPRRSWEEILDNYDFEKETIEEPVMFPLLHNKGQAEIHMMALAEAMWDTYNESAPRELKEGEWHIPFEDKISYDKLERLIGYQGKALKSGSSVRMAAVKIATAMAARVSYTVVGEEKEVSYEKLVELHDKLINQNPLHASPMEHCAIVMSDKEYHQHMRGFNEEDESANSKSIYGWCRNFRGFIQYRHILENGI